MNSQSNQTLDQLCINTIRTLSMDAVQKAHSGHPGTPMALAPVAYAVWNQFLRQNPRNPKWPNRDRFVLSAGHASMLLYSLLHLFGYDLSLEDLKNFRQWNSKCPGHPEYGLTSGVETTTGPLGQGIANSVGMAIAEKWLAAHFNRPGHQIVDYRTFAICGDGDLMEGISSEASSLAGHLALNKLTWIYDNNHITIEGNTSLAFTDDVAARFEALHWMVQRVGDANDLEMLTRALRIAVSQTECPSLIIVDSHIAFGAPTKQDTSGAHGEPLGEDEIRQTKIAYGWPPDANFLVPEAVQMYRSFLVERGKKWEDEWNLGLEVYAREHPALAEEWHTMQAGELPKDWEKDVPVFSPDAKGVAGRDAGNKVLNAIAKNVPWFIGGSADLTPSTKTRINDGGDFLAGSYEGRNLHFGIREHAMGAILNGMALSKLRPYGSGFLIFSDYQRPTLRLSALMELPTIYIFTHDSIGVGEDVPTHQPIEHLVSVRAIPQLIVIRPADANEVAEAWRVIMEQKKHPVALILSRQPMPTLDRTKYAPASGLRKGGYVLADSTGTPEIILLATGTELQWCVEAYEQLSQEGINARVVNMPSYELFERQPREYREQVLPSSVRKRLAVEAGSSLGWRRYVGIDGAIIARRHFGASAPLKDLLKQFGFTTDNVIATAKKLLSGETIPGSGKS